MSSDLQMVIRTTEEKALLESDIELMEKSLFINKQTAWEDALKQIQVSTAQYLTERIKQIPDKQQIINGLKQYLGSLQTLSLSIGCEPTESLIENISEWIMKNMGTNIILELRFDTSVVAGAEIIYKGKIIDLSFRQKVIDVIDKSVL